MKEEWRTFQELIIRAQAERSALTLRGQGWRGPGASYDLESYPGDLSALETELDRKATQGERVALERAIREELDWFNGL